MKMWMFNCKHTSRLVSESMDRELSFSHRMGVRFHLLMCRHCARYRQQLLFIRKLISAHIAPDSQYPDEEMDEKAKERLRELINKHNAPSD